ncbi:ABC transporter ATP-binding protein [Streptomyces sp. B1866]|uniref:ABC transporter ATP-binding protein n=1 Tax=Streptomyces sp. B1866 TaxID=3075431 RepID=UPI00288C85FE|nr:ABC transporter ATP-binding protein [Streptomyces sp. B1866]MDT3400312.1 ABC transporter ATP-binding protein [Streptomyces sp. B1866]
MARLAAWSVLEAGQTFLSGYALARALDDGFLAGERTAGLVWLAVAAVAVAAGAYGTGRVYRAVAALVEPLRDGLVRRVVGRAVAEAGRGAARGGDSAAVSRLTHQVEIARDCFAGLVLVSRSFVFVAAGALAGLCSLAPALLLFVVPPLAAGLALFLATLRPMARRQEAFLKADEKVAEELGALAAGLRDVTAAGAERAVGAAGEERVAAEYRAARTLARWGTSRSLAVGIGGRLPVVLLLVAAPWLLDRGVTAGALAAAFLYLQQSLLPALQNLTQTIGTGGSRLAVVLRRLSGPGLGAGAGAAPGGGGPRHGGTGEPGATGRGGGARGRAGDADLRGRTGGRTGAPAAPATAAFGPERRGGGAREAAPAVELRAVTFAYGPFADPVVRDLDLTVPSGGHLAVVGPSGIGKSTLAGLIAGLVPPRAGGIALGGVPVTGRDPSELARLRVLIPQEAYVFSGTLRDNLCYLRGDAEPVPDAELLAAADTFGLHRLPGAADGLNTPLDPGALSAGERQLVALARAYLSPAPVVLLDEATCHLDPAAEARAELAFARRPGSTLIVIAHRTSSARRADRVLVMDGGHAVCGRHADLLAASALYRDLAGADPAQPSDSDRAPGAAQAGASPGTGTGAGTETGTGPRPRSAPFGRAHR